MYVEKLAKEGGYGLESRTMSEAALGVHFDKELTSVALQVRVQAVRALPLCCGHVVGVVQVGTQSLRGGGWGGQRRGDGVATP